MKKTENPVKYGWNCIISSFQTFVTMALTQFEQFKRTILNSFPFLWFGLCLQHFNKSIFFVASFRNLNGNIPFRSLFFSESSIL